MEKNSTVTDAAKNRFEMVKKMHKETFEKADKEKKADKQIIPMCRFISKTKNYFTSSSCAGRIILLQLPKEENKKDATFHRKWHRKVKEKELWEGIEDKTIGELWFKLDPFILHIGADSLENARNILKVMKKIGIKRGGIMVTKPGKFLIELLGTQVLAFPVKKDDKIIVNKEVMGYMLRRANEKLEKNYLLLKKLEKNFRKELK